MSYEYATEPVEFDADNYSLSILDSMRAYYSFAVVESIGPQRYTVVSGFSDMYQVREYCEPRIAQGALGVRVYFHYPGCWFGQVFCPTGGTKPDDWPDDHQCRRFAERNRILLDIGAEVPCTITT
jgi:hypothetical protein